MLSWLKDGARVFGKQSELSTDLKSLISQKHNKYYNYVQK